jgi:hypothetical protein
LAGVSGAFGFVAGFELAGPGFVVISEDGECGVGDVGAEESRGGSEQGVADFEVGVEERERSGAVEGFEP